VQLVAAPGFRCLSKLNHRHFVFAAEISVSPPVDAGAQSDLSDTITIKRSTENSIFDILSLLLLKAIKGTDL
jgi:hypothetical protein